MTPPSTMPQLSESDRLFIDEHLNAAAQRFAEIARGNPSSEVFGLLRALVERFTVSVMTAAGPGTSYFDSASLIRTAIWTNFAELASELDEMGVASWEQIGRALRKSPNEARKIVMRARGQNQR